VIGVATAPLDTFLNALIKGSQPTFTESVPAQTV